MTKQKPNFGFSTQTSQTQSQMTRSTSRSQQAGTVDIRGDYTPNTDKRRSRSTSKPKIPSKTTSKTKTPSRSSSRSRSKTPSKAKKSPSSSKPVPSKTAKKSKKKFAFPSPYRNEGALRATCVLVLLLGALGYFSLANHFNMKGAGLLSNLDMGWLVNNSDPYTAGPQVNDGS